MQALEQTIRKMINISDSELSDFLDRTVERKFKRHEIISRPGSVPNEIYFVCKGLIRVTITGNDGTEHSIHFALENQFIADYSNYIQKSPSIYTLQATEQTEAVVLSRSAIDWGYQNLQEGQKLGRLIAEYYFIYQDARIKNLYVRTPRERYDTITAIFPDIHNRLPQHMIASYLGITPVHLSRLKKESPISPT